jgi:LPPG:FO 2-phospho-L-lactate transferase
LRAVVLAGGTGGAKLAAGLQELIGSDLAVIANTGDDVRVLGVHVSPDPDLITYWLSGEIDAERGWGIRGDTFSVFERLVELGAPDWFSLSDRDLATCLRRTALIADGARLTEAELEIAAALGISARVLPMCDEPVRTQVRTEEGWRGLQEFLVRERSEPAVLDVTFEGIDSARPTPEVAAALAEADVIVLGPSNPVISIGPIIGVPGMRAALEEARAPVVAVSPFVGGRAIKGPTEKFMRALGEEPSATGVARAYAGVIDALVVDASDPQPAPSEIPTLAVNTLMDEADGRRRVAEQTLEFARSVG